MNISRLNSNDQTQLDALRIGAQATAANQAADSAQGDVDPSAVVPADEANLDALAQMTNLVKESADIRTDVVAAMRKMLANGEDFSSEDIAESIMNSGFVEYFVEG